MAKVAINIKGNFKKELSGKGFNVLEHIEYLWEMLYG